MKIVSQLFRLIRVNYILMRYNIDEIVLGTHWFYPLRFLVYLNPYYWTMDKNMSQGERIRRALEELGPIFVKAGQVISTRRDLLPDDIATELSKLQDRVPPFPGEKAKQIIESALNATIVETFAEFDINALASASIAQVHAAQLLNGDDVVVKVLRPNIRKIIERDIDLLMTLAKLADRYWYNARHFKPKELVNEVAQTLFDELDLMREGANASQLKRNFADSDLLHVPKIYWDYSHANILVMERIYGIPIYDTDKLRHAGVNMRKLAERGIEIFFTQVFPPRAVYACCSSNFKHNIHILFSGITRLCASAIGIIYNFDPLNNSWGRCRGGSGNDKIGRTISSSSPFSTERENAHHQAQSDSHK